MDKQNQNELVYFLRHKMTGAEQEKENLKKRELIAIHFNDEFHEDYKDYKDKSGGFKRAFNCFKTIGDNGALIVFEYDSPAEFTIAEIPRGQKIKPYQFSFKGANIIYKTLKYEKAIPLKYADYAALAAGRPILSTICCPRRKYPDIIKAIYFNKLLPPSADLLHDKMLEQLCEYFLRSEEVSKDIRLAYTVTKLGGTLQNVDIIGRTHERKQILAQVTFEEGKKALAKTEDLIKFKSADSIAIMFSKDIDIKKDGLDYHFNIDDVFNKLLEVNKEMVLELIGINKLLF